MQELTSARETVQVHTHVHTNLSIGHLSVEHLHLCVDVIPLLVGAERAVVPHEEVQRGVQAADVVGASHPCLLLPTAGQRGHAVATVRVARGNDKHVVRNGLERKKRNNNK